MWRFRALDKLGPNRCTHTRTLWLLELLLEPKIYLFYRAFCLFIHISIHQWKFLIIIGTLTHIPQIRDTTSPYRAWLRLNAFYVLACLLACSPACLLPCSSGILRMLQKLFQSHSEHNDTDAHTHIPSSWAPVGAKNPVKNPVKIQ